MLNLILADDIRNPNLYTVCKLLTDYFQKELKHIEL